MTVSACCVICTQGSYTLSTDSLYWWHLQVTVIFFVDIDKCIPGKGEWPEVWAKQQAWKQAKKTHEDEQVSPLP